MRLLLEMRSRRQATYFARHFMISGVYLLPLEHIRCHDWSTSWRVRYSIACVGFGSVQERVGSLCITLYERVKAELLSCWT